MKLALLTFPHVLHRTRHEVCCGQKRVIIFDIAVTFGHCQKAINKGVATLG